MYKLSGNLGAAKVLLGIYSTDANGSAKQKAYDALRRLSRTFSSDFNEFKLYATTNIYASIASDTAFAWLNVHVPTKAEFITSGKTEAEATVYQNYINTLGLSDMQGKKIRAYMIDKLKGKLN